MEPRQQLVDDEPRIAIVDGIVLLLTHRTAVGCGDTGINEGRDHDRQLAAPYQVVEHIDGTVVAVRPQVSFAIVEDHEADLGLTIVLRRNVDPEVMLDARVD